MTKVKKVDVETAWRAVRVVMPYACTMYEDDGRTRVMERGGHVKIFEYLQVDWPDGDKQWPIEPLYDEPVVQAMHLAAELHGSDDGTFNGSNFSSAMRTVSGCQCTLDGNVVAAILTGRKDVEVLSGGSHYRIRKPGQAVPEVEDSEECSARGQAFFDPKEVTPEATPEVTQEVEYRDADHRDVGLEVEASQDKQTWDIVPLLAVLPERKKYRFITDHQGVLFAGYNFARVPAEPMKDAPRNKIIEGYVRNRWMQIESRGDGWVDCDHWKRVDPVRWREVQK